MSLEKAARAAAGEAGWKDKQWAAPNEWANRRAWRDVARAVIEAIEVSEGMMCAGEEALRVRAGSRQDEYQIVKSAFQAMLRALLEERGDEG